MRLYLFLVCTIPSWGLIAIAQVASPTPTPDAGQAAQSAQWLIDLVTKYPQLAVIIFIVGGLRLTLKPLFTFLHQALPAWGLTAWDQNVTAVEQSKPVSFIYWLLDYLGSVKVPVKMDSAK